MFGWLKSLLKRRGGYTVKRHKVDYIRNCVEEKVGHAISDDQYRRAYNKVTIIDCKSLQDRVDAIARWI
jgi:hypothetical protein